MDGKRQKCWWSSRLRRRTAPKRRDRARGRLPVQFLHQPEAGLTIRDHNAQALAQLTPAGLKRFESKTNAGQDVVLSR